MDNTKFIENNLNLRKINAMVYGLLNGYEITNMIMFGNTYFLLKNNEKPKNATDHLIITNEVGKTGFKNIKAVEKTLAGKDIKYDDFLAQIEKDYIAFKNEPKKTNKKYKTIDNSLELLAHNVFEINDWDTTLVSNVSVTIGENILDKKYANNTLVDETVDCLNIFQTSITNERMVSPNSLENNTKLLRDMYTSYIDKFPLVDRLCLLQKQYDYECMSNFNKSEEEQKKALDKTLDLNDYLHNLTRKFNRPEELRFLKKDHNKFLGLYDKERIVRYDFDGKKKGTIEKDSFEDPMQEYISNLFDGRNFVKIGKNEFKSAGLGEKIKDNKEKKNKEKESKEKEKENIKNEEKDNKNIEKENNKNEAEDMENMEKVKNNKNVFLIDGKLFSDLDELKEYLKSNGYLKKTNKEKDDKNKKGNDNNKEIKNTINTNKENNKDETNDDKKFDDVKNDDFDKEK